MLLLPFILQRTPLFDTLFIYLFFIYNTIRVYKPTNVRMYCKQVSAPMNTPHSFVRAFSRSVRSCSVHAPDESAVPEIPSMAPYSLYSSLERLIPIDFPEMRKFAVFSKSRKSSANHFWFSATHFLAGRAQ